jgi:single-strand DNA-binding protein
MTADPELRHTQSGTAVASFSIACDRDFKNQDGSRDTDFLDVVCWRNTAEYADKYFSKGRAIIVTGRLQIREYTDKAGNKRRAAEIVADNLYPADSIRKEERFTSLPDDDDGLPWNELP